MQKEKAKTKAEAEAIAANARDKVSLTEHEAFDRYLRLEKRSLPNLLKVLKDEGHKISMGTLKRWSRRGNWVALGENPDSINMNRVKAMIDTLKTEAAQINSQVYTGLQARLLVRLSEALIGVKVETPTDVIDMIKAAHDVRGLVHDAKGIEITTGGDEDGGDVVNFPIGYFKNPNKVGA